MNRARQICSIVLAGLAALAGASGLIPQRVLLVPLDDRPATTQYAQWIGDMAGITVDLPPRPLLGRFTQPGQPEGILNWMARTDLQKYDAVILSSDMIAYGGLIASRTDRTSLRLAQLRLGALWKIRNRAPRVPFYVFSAIMRLAPTATRESAPWRMLLSRYEELSQMAETPSQFAEKQRLAHLVGSNRIQRYQRTRNRNYIVQQLLIRMVRHGAFNHFVLGQDDAEPTGPHIPETAGLQILSQQLGLATQISYVQGVDQISNCLLSRALIVASGWVPKIRIRLADEEGGLKVASYETQPVDRSMKDQIELSGGQISDSATNYDYTLYVNTPEPRNKQFIGFLKSLKLEVDQGMPVAVADINLGQNGTGDPKLFDALLEADRAAHLLGYSGWNTAGNTMGTAIPAANVYLIGRVLRVDPLARESALRRFLLHRLVADFQYHRFVRPAAYRMIDANKGSCREEIYGDVFLRVQKYIKTDLGQRLNDIFEEELKGKPFYAGAKKYTIDGLDQIKVSLPWPRAYEARLDFTLRITESP